MNDKPQPPTVCVLCHHNNVDREGYCKFEKKKVNVFRNSPAKYCGCHCVFPPSSETMEGETLDANQQWVRNITPRESGEMKAVQGATEADLHKAMVESDQDMARLDRVTLPQDSTRMGNQDSGNEEKSAVVAAVVESAEADALTGQPSNAETIEWLQKVYSLGQSEGSVVPQLNAGEMLARLDGLGFGKQEGRRGNTLYAMVMDAADEVEKLRADSGPQLKDRGIE